MNISETGFYLRLHVEPTNISETGFYLRLHVEPTKMGPIEITSPCLQTSATKIPIGFIKLTQHKPTKGLTFLHLEFPLKWGKTSLYMH
jgi:hypothetical protein